MKTLRIGTSILMLALTVGLVSCTAPEDLDPQTKLITYLPSGESLDIITHSVLERDDKGCLWVRDGKNERLLAAFPKGTRSLSGKVEVPDLGVISYGEEFSYTGSRIPASEAMNRGLMNIPDECSSGTAIWLVLPLTDTKER